MMKTVGDGGDGDNDDDSPLSDLEQIEREVDESRNLPRLPEIAGAGTSLAC